MYYDNFQQVRYIDPYDSCSWHTGLAHHDWLLDYDGYAYSFEQLERAYNELGLNMDESIIEIDWRNLSDDT